jgi:hypothetical protein
MAHAWEPAGAKPLFLLSPLVELDRSDWVFQKKVAATTAMQPTIKSANPHFSWKMRPKGRNRPAVAGPFGVKLTPLIA